MLTLIVSTRNHCIQSFGLRGTFNNDTLMFETTMEERWLALDGIILPKTSNIITHSIANYIRHSKHDCQHVELSKWRRGVFLLSMA